MKSFARIVVALGAILVVLATIVAVRTATFKPAGAVTPVALAAARPVDANGAAARLAQAIRFKTVSHEDPATDDLGEWAKLHAWMQATYPHAHAALQRQDLGRTLIYAWAGSDPALEPIVLMAHQDVVPVEESGAKAWTQEPFAGVVSDGWIWGRGSLDDKSALVSILESVETLAADGFQPKRTVYLVFGHDEEVGGTGAAAAAAWFRSQKIHPEFVLDEGGFALTGNPITGKPLSLIAVAEKGMANIRITALGKGGHSSSPPPATAALVIARAVARIGAHPYPLSFSGPGADTVKAAAAHGELPIRVLAANAWLFEPLINAKMGADPLAAALLHTTIAPTMLEASPKANVLPQRASAVINYRLAPGVTPDAVMTQARRTLRDLPVTLSWEGAPAAASSVSSSRSRAWNLIASLAEASTGAPPAPALSIGATDGRSFDGVARDVYRFIPALVPISELSGMHGLNERLSVENLGRMIGFYRRLIESAAG